MFRGQTIPLQPSPVLEAPDRKLFAADSMTLLIGPNGAGKTQAMGTLASALANKQTEDELVGITWDASEDRCETCAIYYTPVPYSVDIPNSGDRYRKLQPGNSRHKSVRHREIVNELESIFKLDVRRTLSLGYVSRETLASLLSRVTRNTRQKEPYVKDIWITPFRERLESIRIAREEAQQHGTGYDSPEMGALRKRYEENLDDFAIKLREQLGPDLMFKLRAYSHAHSTHRKTDKTEGQLLENIGFSLTTSPWRDRGVASTTYHNAIILLRKVAEIVGDSSLSKNEYLVNDEQAHQLETIQLGKLGKIAIGGLSSGAAALIDQFSSITLACEDFARSKAGKRLLLLIDEGDAFLHIRWQQNYVSYLDRVVRRLKELFQSVQVVVTTHSPVLMSDFPRDCIFMLGLPEKTDDVFASTLAHSPIASFGAPLDIVVRHAGQAGTLGTFAARIMRQLVDDIKKGEKIDFRRVQMIDDPIVRQQIERMLGDQALWANRG